MTIPVFSYAQIDTVKVKLLSAKTILQNDNGKHWGKNIWNDSIIVVNYDNTVYSLVNIPESKTDDGIIYYKSVPPNTFNFANTVQTYEGKKYATVVESSLNDESATIIHDLFHLLQGKFKKYKGDPVDYLDEREARTLLRLEFQALRNTLNAIIENKKKKQIQSYLNDALVFRKMRQTKYSSFLEKELDIENLEGLANYTGFALSSNKNKYEKAILEINGREEAETYTRPFPYATGPAYGLIFDYFKINWRNDITKLCDFLKIYEQQILKKSLVIDDKVVSTAKERCNFSEINLQETERGEKQNRLVEYYQNMFFKNPTLKASVSLGNYNASYNMNGTLSLQDKLIYSQISGEDKTNGENFGNFTTLKGKDELGIAGVMGYLKDGRYFLEFPLPTKIEENKIIGEFYEITLNKNWTIKKEDNGNLSIVKE